MTGRSTKVAYYAYDTVLGSPPTESTTSISKISHAQPHFGLF